MRRQIWITSIVFLCGLAVCLYALHSVTGFTDHARSLRSEAILAMDAGEVQQAEERLVQLAVHLKEHQTLLEIFCDHEDLHSLKGELIDAQASIEFGIEDDFYQAISRFGELLEHLAENQKISWRNIG